jgi:hypothetical protein
MSITKRKIKAQSINNVTGEIHEAVYTQTEHIYKRPVNGYIGAYMKRLADIVDVSKSAQRLFFALVHKVDDYNKVIAKWKDLLDESDANISKAKKELEEHKFIARIGKSYVLNPFVVLSKYQTQAPENQGAVQMIWRRYVEDMNDWYEDIDDDAKELYGVAIKPKSKNIKIGKEWYKAPTSSN